MDAYCPRCQQAMVWRAAGQFHCRHCDSDYRQLALCLHCAQPLQMLTACGAESYFCLNGHGLLSRQRVQFHYQPLSGEIP